MWVTARQGFDKYAIYNTVTDVFEGVNLSKEACLSLRSGRYENADFEDNDLMNMSELSSKYIDDDGNDESLR